jgi:polar amino acid transport system substrate-binding protein
MRRILRRRQLVVAVDENTEGLAARDSRGQLVGLEIDVARAIAKSIFGDDSDKRLRLLTVTTKQKVDYPARGKADLSISAISMTCGRWQSVAFSTEYFSAQHEFLVHRDSPVRSAADLAGRRVCMTKGSTSIDTLAHIGLQPPAKPWLVDARTDCLVALQEGEVDAYFGHDTFLVGMVDQDPGLRIVPQGEAQHYGIAMGKDDITFVRYVNGVLDQLRVDGTLATLYDKQLGRLYDDAGQPRPGVPVPRTERVAS